MTFKQPQRSLHFNYSFVPRSYNEITFSLLSKHLSIILHLLTLLLVILKQGFSNTNIKPLHQCYFRKEQQQYRNNDDEFWQYHLVHSKASYITVMIYNLTPYLCYLISSQQVKKRTIFERWVPITYLLTVGILISRQPKPKCALSGLLIPLTNHNYRVNSFSYCGFVWLLKQACFIQLT